MIDFRSGNEALIRELGIEGMIEYIQTFGLGYGNYARDRKTWLKEQKVEDLLKCSRKKNNEITCLTPSLFSAGKKFETNLKIK